MNHMFRNAICSVAAGCTLIAGTIGTAPLAHAAGAPGGGTGTMSPAPNVGSVAPRTSTSGATRINQTSTTSLPGVPQQALVTRQQVAVLAAIDAFATANSWLGGKVGNLQAGPNGGFLQEFQGFPTPAPAAQVASNATQFSAVT